MRVFTDYLWFTTKKRQEFVRITDEVSAILKKSGIQDGIALVSAMHITAGVYVNDWENGLIEDFQTWLEKLAPSGMPYKHHQTGEDNADAHLKRTLMGHPCDRQGHGGVTGRSYPDRPVIGVGAVVLVGGRVVLVKRAHDPLKGMWNLPGGGVELGETLVAACAREVQEETGLAVEVGPVIEVFDRIMYDETGAVQYHFVLVDYVCRPIAGTMRRGSDASDVVLADPADLAAFGLTPKALDVIAKGVACSWS